MRIIRPLLLLALVAGFLLALPVGLHARPNQAIGQQKKRHKHPRINGTVVAIHHNPDKKGTGTIKVHLHHKPRQNAVNQQIAQAKAAKNAIGQKKKKKPQTVAIHVTPQTRFAYVFKGLVAGKPHVKTVGRGRNKSQVVLPGKVKMATRKIPTHFRNVAKGQFVHVKLAGGNRLAREVDIVPQKSQQAQGNR